MKRQVFLIAGKELKGMARQNALKILFAIIIILLGFALYAGHIAYKQQKVMVETAQKERRAEWLDQGNKHPHIAAHYGTYVFKPKTLLSLFDFGLDTYTGTSVYLEAHYPHEFMFRPVQGYGNMIRFGELSAALVLQLLLPLLIIFITFQTFTKEKETGTLKLLVSQGVSIRSIYLGKVLAYSLIVFSIMVPFFTGLYIVGVIEKTSAVINDMGLRILLLFCVYVGYLWAFTNFSVWISLKSSSARNALLTLLIFWIATGIIIPKTSANLGETLQPLPSMKTYKEGIQHDIENGMNTNETKEKRMARLKEDYLQQYGVDSLNQLPLNFGGIQMQEGEEYANKVHDFHDAALYKKFERQNKAGSLMGFVAPYIAVRNLSMAFAATDWYSFNDFQEKTNTYRRHLIRTMNNDMAKNSRYGEFYEYKAGRNLWETISDFKYLTPKVTMIFKYYWMELASLSFWVLIMFILIPSSSKNKLI
ncbi:ABC transporter permease [Algibacter lectus]|uniref:ABC-2 type transport system permease protein n=1 Tax=Algibacter lectus TaxID=221126 RepID=A0A090VG17_9FLAO|nr:DUF3526 domain-containing protein [Algibacter lectus]GAL63730.1 hypothetical protein JCM19300_2766 [Algibacter lectus]SFB90575.1 ABC-2 type transport system permease protein [Algibacter lectus]